eukprot:1156711-Pelagomonas_calceolata.AAC.2
MRAAAMSATTNMLLRSIGPRAFLLVDETELTPSLSMRQRLMQMRQELMQELMQKDARWPISDGAKPVPISDGTKPVPISDGAKPVPISDGAKPVPISDGAKPVPMCTKTNQ